MKCNRCGLESDVEEAFYKVNSLFSQQAFCPDCALVRQRNQALFYYLGLPLVGGWLYWGGLWFGLGEFLLRLSLIFLIMIPLIVFHELSHMLVAQLVRFRVFGIHIGVGRTLLRFSVNGLPWEIHALPLGGFTIIGSGPTPNYRLKSMLIFAAGPFIHLVLGGWVFWWFQGNYWGYFLNPIVYEILLAFLVANAVTFLGNIWPRKAQNLPGAPGTDGWNLFRLPFIKDSEVRERQAGYFATEALFSYRSNDPIAARRYIDQALSTHPDSLTALNILGMVRMQVEDFEGSRDTFLQLLNRPGLPKMFRYVALNNVAYSNILMGDPSLLEQSDEYSREAYEKMPWIPAVVGTRGVVLAAMGEYDEGIALLKKAISAQADKQDIAADSYHLSMAEAARGDISAAKKHYELARKLDEKLFLRKMAEQALEAAGAA